MHLFTCALHKVYNVRTRITRWPCLFFRVFRLLATQRFPVKCHRGGGSLHLNLPGGLDFSSYRCNITCFTRGSKYILTTFSKILIV
jgi:hypothetical protein